MISACELDPTIYSVNGGWKGKLMLDTKMLYFEKQENSYCMLIAIFNCILLLYEVKTFQQVCLLWCIYLFGYNFV